MPHVSSADPEQNAPKKNTDQGLPVLDATQSNDLCTGTLGR